MSPIYEYTCPAEHTWEERRRIAQRDDPSACPECDQPGERTISLQQRPIVHGGTNIHHSRGDV